VNTSPLVSVIIPCYNQGLYIEETLNSVFIQTYDNIEIIVINDGSSDLLTKDKLSKISADSRVKYLSIENIGVSAARNFAINISLGDYIFPLDADDLISESYIEKAVSLLVKDETIDLVYCRAVYFGERSGEIELGDYDLKSMLCKNQIFNSVLLRKQKIIAIDGYDENFKLGWEDWDFYLRYIGNSSQVYKINEILFQYRIKNESRNESLISDRLNLVERQLYYKHINLYKNNFSFPISRIRNYESDKSRIDDLNSCITNMKNSLSFQVGSFITFPVRIIYKFLLLCIK
jgi:glycosyltransferase involved in cell wall biosynthesis